MTGDRNPLHYDEALAGQPLRRDHRAGRRHLGAAQRGRRRGPPRPGQRVPPLDWRFLAPVRPGDEITAEVEVLELRDDKPVARCAPPSSTRTASSCSTAPPWCTASRSSADDGPLTFQQLAARGVRRELERPVVGGAPPRRAGRAARAGRRGRRGTGGSRRGRQPGRRRGPAPAPGPSTLGHGDGPVERDDRASARTTRSWS